MSLQNEADLFRGLQLKDGNMSAQISSSDMPMQSQLRNFRLRPTPAQVALGFPLHGITAVGENTPLHAHFLFF